MNDRRFFSGEEEKMEKQKEKKELTIEDLSHQIIVAVLALGIMIIVFFLVLCAKIDEAKAEELQVAERVSGYIDIRNDFVYPENGKSVVAQSLNTSWKYKQFSGLLETSYTSATDSFTLKPSVQFYKGPWAVLAGLSANEKGTKFVQAGIWYSNKFWDFVSVAGDFRNYFSTTGRDDGYFDGFVRVMIPTFIEKLSVGVDLDYLHWWNGQSHDLYFAGPRIYYQLTETIGIYARAAYQVDVKGSVETETFCYRIAGVIKF
jgi:hypothetical protein